MAELSSNPEDGSNTASVSVPSLLGFGDGMAERIRSRALQYLGHLAERRSRLNSPRQMPNNSVIRNGDNIATNHTAGIQTIISNNPNREVGMFMSLIFLNKSCW